MPNERTKAHVRNPRLCAGRRSRRRLGLHQLRAADPDLRDHVFPADPPAAEEDERPQGHGRTTAPWRSGADPGWHRRQGGEGARGRHAGCRDRAGCRRQDPAPDHRPGDEQDRARHGRLRPGT
ncbi:UNVERIFIED_CONTAM: hypothetical protein NCL1_02996 [Trichonephila clavipes]